MEHPPALKRKYIFIHGAFSIAGYVRLPEYFLLGLKTSSWKVRAVPVSFREGIFQVVEVHQVPLVSLGLSDVLTFPGFQWQMKVLGWGSPTQIL